jgi:hypothetical protein
MDTPLARPAMTGMVRISIFKQQCAFSRRDAPEVFVTFTLLFE